MLQIHKPAPVGASEQVGGVLLPPCVASLASKDLGTEQTLGWVCFFFFLAGTLKRKWTLKNPLYPRSNRIKPN